MKIFTDNIEQNALEQLNSLVAIPAFAGCKIRVMPDVHTGAGCVIGFTGNLGDKVIPNIVGVDIGCGMRVKAFRVESTLDFHGFQEHINTHVPAGMNIRDDKKGYVPLCGEDMDLYREAKEMLTSLRCYRELERTQRINRSMGTLGGGNHFIELDTDGRGDWIYLVVHTGSRNLGKQVAEHYQDLAVKYRCGWGRLVEEQNRIITEFKATGRRKEIQTEIKKLHKAFGETVPDIPRDLCWTEGELREDYLNDMRICQRWAEMNRRLIVSQLMSYFSVAEEGEEFESVHNYIGADNIVRKGAVSARRGERCIIPLNMRDGSLLCTGLGNDDWNCSAPHGAGRVMSRTEAYERVDLDEFRHTMQGIYSESINDHTRDESPMVYKPATEIIFNISDTVRIDRLIKPIFNFKA